MKLIEEKETFYKKLKNHLNDIDFFLETKNNIENTPIPISTCIADDFNNFEILITYYSIVTNKRRYLILNILNKEVNTVYQNVEKIGLKTPNINNLTAEELDMVTCSYYLNVYTKTNEQYLATLN